MKAKRLVLTEETLGLLADFLDRDCNSNYIDLLSSIQGRIAVAMTQEQDEKKKARMVDDHESLTWLIEDLKELGRTQR